MGLSSFPIAAEGVLPVLVMNTVISVALLKNMVRSVLQVMGANWNPPDYEQDPDASIPPENERKRRISTTQFKSLTASNSGVSGGDDDDGSGGDNGRAGGAKVECCVCLSGFEAEEEVSELSCKHFFHKGCLDKWFDNKHSTCPLCRSIL